LESYLKVAYLIHTVYKKHDQHHSLLQAEGSNANPAYSVRKCNLALFSDIQISVVVMGFCDKETEPRILKTSIYHDFSWHFCSCCSYFLSKS